MKRLLILLPLLLGLSGWTHGNKQPSSIQIAIGSGDWPYMFVNFFLTAGSVGTNPNLNGLLPSVLNINGYPTSTPTARIVYSQPSAPACTSVAPCELGFTGTGAVLMLSGTTAVSDPGGCMVASSYFIGTNCVVQFYWTSGATPSPLSIAFPPNGDGGHTISYSSFSAAYLIRESDKTAYTSCVGGTLTACFTPEWLTVFGHLKPLAIRTLGFSFPNQVANAENECQWKYRTPTAAFVYTAWTWIPNIWAGNASGTDQYTTSSYTDMPVGWQDGECFQANFNSAGSSYPALAATTPASDSGVVQLPITASGTLTTATIVSNVLVGTASGTITAGMYVNDGTDAAGVCTIVSGSAGTYTTSGCTNTASTTIRTYTPVAASQRVLVQNTPSTTPPTVYTSTGLTFSGCLNAAVACLDLTGSTYSASWLTGGVVTTTTINVGSRGAKFVTGAQGQTAPGIIGGGTKDFGTFVYDGLLGIVLYQTGGMNAGIPPEMQVAAANALKVPLWFNIPPYWTEANYSSISGATAYFSANLTHDLYIENNNEQWNANFQANWYILRGWAIGLTTQGNLSYTGLQDRINFGTVTSNWGQSAAKLHRVLAAQAFGTPSLNDTYKFQGSTLCGTTCGNSLYQAAIGTDYNVSPNRPIDYADAISIATYFQGAQENGNNGTLVQLTGTCNGSTCSGIIAAAACYAAPSNSTCGTGGTATLATAFIYADNTTGSYVGGGTCSDSGQEFTIGCQETNIWGPWNTVAVAEGKPMLAYEGGWSSLGQTAAYLTSIGDANATADATNINNLLVGYRTDPSFYTLYTYWNTTWLGNSKATGNSNLTVQGGGSIAIHQQNWSLMLGSILPLPITYFKNFTAIQAIN